MQRSLAVGVSVSLGFLAVFSAVGLAIYHLSASVDRWTPWATIVIGVALVVLGIAMLRGYEPALILPKLQNGGGKRRTGASMFVFGVSYAVASISCALPLFTSAVAGTFRRANLVSSLAVFVAYSLGMTLVLLALTVSLGMAKQGVLRWLRKALPHVTRASGLLLIVAGAYLVHYGWYERRVRGGDLGESRPVDTVTGLVRRHRELGQRRRRPPASACSSRSACCPSSPPRSGSGPATASAARVGRFAELLAHDGVEEDLELRSRFGFLAFHGGNLEVGTDVVAARAAEAAGASLYAVRQPDGLRWHVPSIEVTPDESTPLGGVPRPRRRRRRPPRLRPRGDVDHPAARRRQPRARHPRRRAPAHRAPRLRGGRRARRHPARAARRAPGQPGQPLPARRACRSSSPRACAAGRRTGPTCPRAHRSPHLAPLVDGLAAAALAWATD